MFRNLKNKCKIVDIGCGDNIYSNAIGIDKYYDEADIKMDIDENKLPFKNNSKDKVISMDSIEHFGNPKHVFKEVYRILRPGGEFLIETFNINCLWIKYFPLDHNKLWRHKIGTKRTTHLTHWTSDMLKMWLELNNFKPIKIVSSIFRMKLSYKGIKI